MLCVSATACIHARSHTRVYGCGSIRATVLPGTNETHPGRNPGANLRSISHRCYFREVAFERELTKETIYLPFWVVSRVNWCAWQFLQLLGFGVFPGKESPRFNVRYFESFSGSHSAYRVDCRGAPHVGLQRKLLAKIRFGVSSPWQTRKGGPHWCPQKALCGGIPGSFLEPLARSWSHFVGTSCQKLTHSS